jgi:3-phenylpropionate/trans-cinnamate dioxygenase ferredoxin component
MEIRATNLSALSATEARAFTLGGREIVLCQLDGEIHALDGVCTHEDLPLDGGEVEDGILECPWHGARYEVCTGRVRALPATRPLRTYPVRVDPEGNVFVTLDD